MSSKLVAQDIREEVRSKKLYAPIQVVNFFEKYYGSKISYNHTWLGVEKAGLFPVAFGVVDSKDDENWLWFLRKLSGILSPRPISFRPFERQTSERRYAIVSHSHLSPHLPGLIMSESPIGSSAHSTNPSDSSGPSQPQDGSPIPSSSPNHPSENVDVTDEFCSDQVAEDNEPEAKLRSALQEHNKE
ncbi:hypothetical protein Vadar_020618 [Vaccinium darrowii]|uniref:Uncharacterized protein n=1 Tax=Vaccinium darrowii TaxID=229202 RepID=A0ACB7YY22_9ERIC|nr:hypothetical protein Vadar_020618 [Vaccinium darrowii]